MSRLVAFGCSHAYGYGLPDCYIPPASPGPEPSKLAWPKLLGDKLGLETINKSVPGGSNRLILLNLLDFEFQDGDQVVVMWTYTHRHLLFEDSGDKFNVSISYTHPGFPERASRQEQFYKLHTDLDLYINTMVDILHANQLLQNKNIKITNISIDPGLYKFDTYKPDNLIHINLREEKKDIALDHTHFGVHTNEHLANIIFTKMKENT